MFFSVSMLLAVEASLRLDPSLKALLADFESVFNVRIRLSCDFYDRFTRNVRSFQISAEDFAFFNALNRHWMSWFLKVSLSVEWQKVVNLTVRDIQAC